MSDLPAEFRAIARHFRPLAGPEGLDLLDDAALLDPPPGRTLVLTADAMVAGVHFLPDDSPDLIARKLLRVNLSDLAAKGAVPMGYLLTLSIPADTPDAWLAAFAAGLAADQAEFGVALYGGDTTATPGPPCLSLTAIGSVAPGGALRRAGARPGDELWVSGTIGDGALGLLAARGEIDAPALADRYRLPRPRLALGQALAGIATACMDVSDGLVQDAGHLARAAGCAIGIDAAAVPRSLPESDLELCLTGGDDYELLFAAPPGRHEAVLLASRSACIPVSRIGGFRAGAPHVTVRGPDGTALHFRRGGWSHLA